MQKICAIILLSALASNYEALPQTKWSRPTRHSQGQLTRERRQFPFGEWIPLSQPCPTCRPFADPLDVGLRGDNIGLTPPRPPAVTRQIHGEGNFFPQDESSILSVPPPPPSAIPRHPITSSNGNFQFSSFGQQFNSPLGVPAQKVFPQTQQIQFLPQTFLSNQPLLIKGNQQILSGLNAQNNFFGQDQNQQQINNGKVTNFNSEFKTQKLPENVVLEQNKKPVSPKQAFSNKPQPFTQSQQNQQHQLQTFGQQQSFNGQQQSFSGQQQSFSGQQQHPVNLGSSILTPPPAPNNVSQDIVIPGLDKEEIQLLYVPVETLRQRGTAQEQLLVQKPQNVQLYNKGNGAQRPVNNARPTEQTLVTPARGNFVTQKGNGHGQADNSLKVTSTQPFSTSATPSTIFLQHLPFQQTPQPFVSATPTTPTIQPFVTQTTPTIQPFVTPATVFQKFSSFAPETTLPHLSTVPNTIQFSQSGVEFGTTPKTFSDQGAFKEEITNGKPQFSGLKDTGFNQELPLHQHLQQPFVNQQQVVTQQPKLNTVFPQEQQKELLTQTQFPHQINQQQEHQRFLQQQHQKELEEKRFLEQQRQQKQLEEQRLLQQQQQQRQKELEQQRLLQKQKEAEEQRLLQQQRQKELEQQRFLQKQKEAEEQRLLQQQRQKELEQQRFLQKQKEAEEQRLLQQRRQKELEQQRFLQKQKELEEQKLLQQRQKEEQRFLQEQRQKELEEQRLLQLQRQRELDEKRRLQLKQKEEEQRLLRFQKQQRELENQRLLQQQQEEQQRLLQQQKLQEQKQENLRKQQQFQFFQQQQKQLQQQQQKQSLPQQVLQQVNRHVLPGNDQLNFIPQLEKESEPEDQTLVPHQPPLSVFFKGSSGAEARVTDVLRELRSSNTITVLDQYFEKMPKVFVGPAGLIPPPGYGKFELPYLSNLESNRIERRIDKLPFFVAPLNFVPPPGYAKIPFPAPHVGSVVVSSESNPAMTLNSAEKTSVQEVGSYPVVGPELPGLINNLNTETTTVKPSTYVSTPSLPQTTAQLRNRRPNTSLYKSQNRKPITRTRPTTTSKPEVTQSVQKTENSEGGVRKPFNRFLNRRRQQTKTSAESLLKDQQDGKSLENRHYSVEVYHQEKNQLPKSQQKSDEIQEKQNEKNDYNGQFEQRTTSIDRITPSGHEVFEVNPTPDFSTSSQAEAFEVEDRRPEVPDYVDVNLQSFEDGPLPTGSAKTITQELYHPNGVNQAQESVNSKTPESVSTQSPITYQSEIYEDRSPTIFSRISDVSPTVGLGNYKGTFSEEQTTAETTPIVEFEKQDGSSERHDTTEIPRTKVTFMAGPSTSSEEQSTKRFLDSREQYTTAFAEISKPHHLPGYVDSSVKQQSTFSEAYPTAEISVDLQAPFSQKNSQELYVSGELKPTENSAEFSDSKFAPTGSSNEQYLSGFEGVAKDQQPLEIPTSQVSPTAPGAIDSQYTADFAVNSESQNSSEVRKNAEDERIGSFISLYDIHSTAGYPESAQQYFLSSTEFPSPSEPGTVNIRSNESLTVFEENQAQISSTPETSIKITVNPSVQTYSSEFGTVSSAQINDQTLSSEGQIQDTGDNLPNGHRLKLSNPSIVRVRTRVRGKSRGQVNFAASQSTTPVTFTRSGVENTEHEDIVKTNHFRDYHPVKTSKFNQFRGVKKPVRTTTESTTEYEQKANIYTIRPQRRPLNPSTVSTKRIRRPTTPLPFAEPETEAFGISTAGSYSQSEHSDISPSGVSNDVYYEQSSLSPTKHKLRKHFGSVEHKNDFVPSYVSTPYTSPVPTYSSFAQEYNEESYGEKTLPQTPAPAEYLESSEKYPEWNPSESGFDVSGIVLTTTSTPGYEHQPELEELKKTLDNKKAFDPDLEKKTGRRRVRVRVHKRPHESFETAESQNLRTVANVLVPPTTTYKPKDESSFHQLAKNADFSFGGQKLFGLRSREYFRKRLNLTATEEISQNVDGEQPTTEKIQGIGENTERPKVSGFLRKIEKSHKNDTETTPNQSNETSEGHKFARPKVRGFVRKVVKHGKVSKEADSESNQVPEIEENEEKHESVEFHPRQQVKIHQGGYNYTGRFTGTRHKTFVRYVKKNKVRQHETESSLKSSTQQFEKEEHESHQTTESYTSVPESQKVTKTELPAAEVEEETSPETHFSVTHKSSELENFESKQPETTEESSLKETQQPLTQTTQAAVESDENHESSSPIFQESTSDISQPITPLTQPTGLYLTSKPKFYQTLRPLFQRTTQTEFSRTKEPDSYSSTTTEQIVQEPLEKRTGFTRLKYGKTTSFGTTNTEKSEEIKKPNDQQLKNKNLHTLEVKKYLRTKSREGAFSQFSKNKYLTSEKPETTVTTTGQESTERESATEKIFQSATEKMFQTSPNEFKTTQVFESQTDSTEIEDESTENYEESEPNISTTETVTEEDKSSEKEEVTSSGNIETTTENEILTSVFQASSSETHEKLTTQTTEKVEVQQTEYQPDIYRFSKNSFSFDEAEKFTGTKNRAHVRNITSDIIENTASFSAPGVEKRPDIRVVTNRADEQYTTPPKSHSDVTQKEKTEEATTELSSLETTTDYTEPAGIETTASTEAYTKAKVAKILKTSTTTKISHETEICYRGKCIRTKSENPDEDLKLLVDSASTMKIEKTKT